MPRPPARRRGHLLLALGTGVVLSVGAVAPAGAAPLPAAPAGTCPAEGQFPGITTGSPLAADGGVAVFVGGDYAALPGAAESEGVLAVVGDARLDSGALLNVGRAGGGSQIVPPAGSDMLLTGGDLTVASGHVDVGHGIVGADGAAGGNVVSGGGATPRDRIETNGGAVRAEQGAAVAATLGSVGDTLTTLSDELARRGATGTTTLVGDRLTLTARAGDDLHVFDVTADQLAAAGALLYVGIGTTPVVVNVSGSDVDYRVVHTAVDTLGNRVDDPSDASIGNTAAQVLWNLAEASSVDLGAGAAPSQLVGSVLVPEPASQVRQVTHTNGRLWVGGDLTFGGAGAGLEHHSYPWTGSPELGCTPLAVPPVDTEEPELPETPEQPAPPAENHEPSEPGEPRVDDESSAPATPGATPETTPVADDEPVPSPAADPAAETDGLASTGASVALLATVAALLLAGGATLLVLGTRRRAAR